MDIVKLKSRMRTGKGKSYARKARAQDWIPAVYYGHHEKAESIEVDASEFWALVRARKQGHLIELNLPGKADAVAVVKEIQKHPVQDKKVFHIDFQHVSMDEKVSVRCRVVILGVPVGVKDEGGIFEHQLRELAIECLPMDIPEEIEVEVGGLNIGDAIHVKDISVPNVTFKHSPEEVIALVARPAKEEEATPTAEGEEGVAEGEEGAAEGAKKEGEEKKDDKKDEKKDDKKKEK